MPFTALVTGASAGLGAEFCRQLSDLGVDVVLVARDEGRLRSIADALPTRSEVLVADLLTPEGTELVRQRLQDPEHPVDILVNNAGFGIAAGFDESELGDERSMHELLSWVPLSLCHAVIPGMKTRGRGWIINVASFAGLIPGGTYSAAKAALISLSRSLGLRFRADGIRVTALCPGFTHTEFHERMGTGEGGVPPVAWADAAAVVRDGIRGVRAGRLVTVSDVKYRLLRPFVPLVPRAVMERIVTAGHRSLRQL